MGISVGLVGLGAFGSEFAPLFMAHPLVDRIALCDREPERVRKFASDPRFGAKLRPSDAYASLDEICAAELDALVIITQPWLHAPQAVKAMEAGKDVYSAVPIVSLPDGDEVLDWCDRIIAACRRTGKRYMLGETTFYRPEAMFCRRKAAVGAFGAFVHAEGHYYHDVDHGLREVKRWRESSASGKEWLEERRKYAERGVIGGPMHYPTHSTSGPICVMKAHMVKVCAWGMRAPKDEPFFEGNGLSNETGFFLMSNGATCRIAEYRLIGYPCLESFNVYGTEGCFQEGRWIDKHSSAPLTAAEMRDPLPEEYRRALVELVGEEKIARGHGGSHVYLVNEFVEAVAQDRMPAINAWEAARYMAAGVMAHKSVLRGGEVLEVPDWGDAPDG